MSEVISKPLPKITESDANRFWSKVALTSDPNKCWNWEGSKRRKGYGRIAITVAPNKDISVIVTRLSYYLHHNIDPIGKAILHSCDNPSCVNPNHLLLGSNKDNTDDMMKKGRGVQPKGSHHGKSKLTEEIVLAIREKFKNGVPPKDLRKEYTVDQGQLSRILNRKAWVHI